MKSVVQARLDAHSQKRLDELVQQLGWSPSKVVREGLRLLAVTQPRLKRPRIIGLGQFSSGCSDLGSNKKHLRGFGG